MVTNFSSSCKYLILIIMETSYYANTKQFYVEPSFETVLLALLCTYECTYMKGICTRTEQINRRVGGGHQGQTRRVHAQPSQMKYLFVYL